MTALTRAPIGVIRSVPESWRMYRRLVEELAALAQASGVHLAPDVVDSIVRDASALAPALYSSLHHDLTQGRRLELEALHGHAVRLGRAPRRAHADALRRLRRAPAARRGRGWARRA